MYIRNSIYYYLWFDNRAFIPPHSLPKRAIKTENSLSMSIIVWAGEYPGRQYDFPLSKFCISPQADLYTQ